MRSPLTHDIESATRTRFRLNYAMYKILRLIIITNESHFCLEKHLNSKDYKALYFEILPVN